MSTLTFVVYGKALPRDLICEALSLSVLIGGGEGEGGTSCFNRTERMEVWRDGGRQAGREGGKVEGCTRRQTGGGGGGGILLKGDRSSILLRIISLQDRPSQDCGAIGVNKTRTAYA